MAVQYDYYKRHEKWIRRVAALWLRTITSGGRHRKAERLLCQWGFTSWNLVSLAYGELDYE